MKKIILFLAIFIGQLASMQALTVEGRVGYIYPQNKHIRDTYGKSGYLEYEVELGSSLNSCLSCCNKEMECGDNIALWANWSYYSKKGRSSCLRNRIHMQNWAANFGAKYYFDLQNCALNNCFFDLGSCFCDQLYPYLGFGLGVGHVRFSDHGPDVKSHNKLGFSLLAKSGVEYRFGCNLFLDFFLDYAYNHFSKNHSHRCISSREINTGGLKTGIGLGFRF